MLSVETTTPVLRIELGEHAFSIIEQKVILATLERFEGNKARTARSLGICLKTLYNKLDKYEAA